MADASKVADVQAMMQLSDENPGNFRLDGAATVNAIDGYTAVSIIRVDPTTFAATKVGDFLLTAADWTALQALYPTLTQSPM